MVAFCGRYCQADADCLRALLRRYKQLPGPAHAALAPAEMRALQDGDGAFMARPLVHWQAIHGADDGALGAYLGLTPHRLGLLAYYRRPDPESTSYGDDLRYLARQCGCDAGQMAALLANVEERDGCCSVRRYGPDTLESRADLNERNSARYGTRRTP